MPVWDAVLVLVMAVWWVFYRKNHDWKAVMIFYLGGVMFADLFCAGLILLHVRRHPLIISAPAFIMPLGGLVGLGYGAGKNKLRKGSGLFQLGKTDGEKPTAPLRGN